MRCRGGGIGIMLCSTEVLLVEASCFFKLRACVQSALGSYLTSGLIRLYQSLACFLSRLSCFRAGLSVAKQLLLLRQ